MLDVAELSPEMLARFARARYPHDLALIATLPEDGRETVQSTSGGARLKLAMRAL